MESVNYISIKQLAKDDRPREKLLENGRSALSNAEILAIIIGSGTRQKSAVVLCQEILQSVDNDLSKLARLTVHDLMKFKGVGEAKAVSITAALELGRRKRSTTRSETRIESSSDIYEQIKHRFEDLEHEEFYVVLLSRANKVKAIELISKGGLSGTVADGKLIFKAALEQAASGIILCHNHPSGNLKPSNADIQLTGRMKEFGAFIELPVLDHLIITDEGYFSFADEGMM
ncbi:DNA repair protein RadC [Crocinitomix catalasitica]|nr:DNA repair protein RadC [Crocinitomix catalasitica]